MTFWVKTLADSTVRTIKASLTQSLSYNDILFISTPRPTTNGLISWTTFIKRNTIFLALSFMFRGRWVRTTPGTFLTISSYWTQVESYITLLSTDGIMSSVAFLKNFLMINTDTTWLAWLYTRGAWITDPRNTRFALNAGTVRNIRATLGWQPLSCNTVLAGNTWEISNNILSSEFIIFASNLSSNNYCQYLKERRIKLKKSKLHVNHSKYNILRWQQRS